MQKVELNIFGNFYQMSCQEGEKAKLQNLAANLDNKLKILAKKYPHASSNYLMLVQCLFYEDEINDLKNNNSPIQDSNSNIKDEENILEELKQLAEETEL
jgi:cell division protein ZapA (FtsZ GTPase activity inhibitor)